MQIDISVISILITIAVGICTIITFVKTNAKNEANRAAEMATLHNELKHQGEDIKELSERVDKHNKFAERMPVIEEKIEVANHRISDLESESQSDIREIKNKLINMTRRQ